MAGSSTGEILGSDDYHFSADDMILLGQNAARAMFRNLTMLSGATLRMEDGSMGLRYTARIPAAMYASVVRDGSYVGGCIFGMIIVPKSYFDDFALQYQKDIPSKEWGFARAGSPTGLNWTKGRNHGFSSAAEDKLFLPIDSTTSVEKMRSDQSSLYWLVKALIALRKQETMLHGNMIEVVPQRDKRLLVYKRGDLTVAVNPACTEKTVEGRFDRVLFSDGDVCLCDGGIVLSAQSACVVG